MAPTPEELKTARSSAKRAVTKQVNYIRQCIAMDNIDDLAAEVDKLKSVFQKFDGKNNDFAATLSDDNDLDECEDYFSEVQNNFIKVLEQVKRILHACSPAIQTPAQSPTDSN